MPMLRKSLFLAASSFVVACASSAGEPADKAAPAVLIAAPAAAPAEVAAKAAPEENEQQAPTEKAESGEEAEPERITKTENPAPSPWLAGATRPDLISLQGGTLVLPEPLRFKTGKAVFLPSSEPLLDLIATFLAAKPEITTLRIEGHTDNRGNSTFNAKLAGDRALAVAKALVQRHIACKRLVPVTFGETKPIADNTTAEGREQNRRITIVIAALRGKAVGNLPLDGGGSVSGDACP